MNSSLTELVVKKTCRCTIPVFGNQPFMTSLRVQFSTELKVKQEKEVMDGLVSFNDKLKMHIVGKGS